MRHILNVIGPPAVGKSTVIRSLNEYLPDYEVWAIDDIRLQKASPEREAEVWREIWVAALKADGTIIESSGTSPHLLLLSDRLWRAPGTHIFTVALEAPLRICRQRDRQRQNDTGEQPAGVYTEKWVPLPELAIGLSIRTAGKTPSQTVSEILEKLPPDFR
ncbi:MAG: AAA family ATPase [Spirosomataceae bacterium]